MQKKLSILVVDDDPLARKVMDAHLNEHRVDFAPNLLTARKKLESNQPDICFIDLKLGEKDDYSGLKLIPLASAKGVYSVVMSSHDSESVIEQAHSLGCRDFFAKGNEASNVSSVIAKYYRNKTGFNSEQMFSQQFITEDPITRAAVLDAIKYASSDLPILILGPSGTGKTRLGRIVHEQSGRKGEFVAINCSAYTEDLLEAELFGHKKGAFTGADEERKGKLLQADQGTLFLDEIGAMSLNMQAKLLKAIEERTFYPVGSDEPEQSEFRIVSATLENLQRLVAQGRLRFDFFQRIHGWTVNLKPLAQRKGDILPLIRFFTKEGKRLSFSPEAKACLLNHDWPGNTRELKKFVELLSAGTDGRVTLEQVKRHLSQAYVEPSPVKGTFVDDDQYRYAVSEGLAKALERFEAEIIRKNLKENRGVKRKTLSELKIAWRKLYAVLKNGCENIC